MWRRLIQPHAHAEPLGQPAHHVVAEVAGGGGEEAPFAAEPGVGGGALSLGHPHALVDDRDVALALAGAGPDLHLGVGGRAGQRVVDQFGHQVRDLGDGRAPEQGVVHFAQHRAARPGRAQGRAEHVAYGDGIGRPARPAGGPVGLLSRGLRRVRGLPGEPARRRAGDRGRDGEQDGQPGLQRARPAPRATGVPGHERHQNHPWIPRRSRRGGSGSGKVLEGLSVP